MNRDKLDELQWRVASRLADPELANALQGEAVLVIARIGDGNINVEVVSASWNNVTVGHDATGVYVHRLCEFCAREAAGRVPATAEFAPGSLVCDRCRGTLELEPLEQ